MAEMPRMDYWPDAYLADTRHLSLEEHGAYHLLLLIAWRAPACALPNDDRRLAQMLGISARRWARIKPAVMAFWDLGESGWTQKRQQKERRRANLRSKKASDSAHRRWNANPLETLSGGDAEAYANADATADANAMLPYTNNQSSKPTAVLPSQKPPPKARGKRLSEDWTPSPQGIAFAASAGLSGGAIREAAESFRDYWIAKAGREGCKLDWEATWRNWIRREGKQASARKPAFVSSTGFEYRGSIDDVIRRSAERRDWDTHWKAKRAKERPPAEEAKGFGGLAGNLVSKMEPR